MEKTGVKKLYVFLLAVLLFFATFVVGVLVTRANQADRAFANRAIIIGD